MDIEYLNKFEELQERNTFKGQQWFGEREGLVTEYSWAVPNQKVIRYIAEFEHIYEIGAGNGYWAKLIEDAGGSIIPIDKQPPTRTYTDVEEADVVEYLEAITDQPVLVVWPPADDNLATTVLKQGPSHMLYVGEPRGGCTADDTFFDLLDREYGLVGKLDIPSYEGVHDNFFHYVRKK